MLSVIIGDIVGSRFEFMSTQEKDVQLFHSACSFTDDTVCHAAITQANLKNKSLIFEEYQKTYIQELTNFCKNYPMAGYGKGFHEWIKNPVPYSSNANGCLMRISSVSLIFDYQIDEITKAATDISHNHPEALLYTKYYSQILFILKQSCLENRDEMYKKNTIKEFLVKHHIKIESVENYHTTAGYHVFAKPTLERALASWLEAESFEETLKNSLYIGSDTDTTCAIAATFAEYTWGISDGMLEQLYRYFDFKNIELLKIVCSSYKSSSYYSCIYDSTKNYIDHIIHLKLTDPTAAYDALDIPSDEDYFKGKKLINKELKLLDKIKRYLHF